MELWIDNCCKGKREIFTGVMKLHGRCGCPTEAWRKLYPTPILEACFWCFFERFFTRKFCWLSTYIFYVLVGLVTYGASSSIFSLMNCFHEFILSTLYIMNWWGLPYPILSKCAWDRDKERGGLLKKKGVLIP